MESASARNAASPSTASTSTASFDKLVDDVIGLIIEQLPLEGASRLTQVSRRFNSLTFKPRLNLFWKESAKKQGFFWGLHVEIDKINNSENAKLKIAQLSLLVFRERLEKQKAAFKSKEESDNHVSTVDAEAYEEGVRDDRCLKLSPAENRAVIALVLAILLGPIAFFVVGSVLTNTDIKNPWSLVLSIFAGLTLCALSSLIYLVPKIKTYREERQLAERERLVEALGSINVDETTPLTLKKL